MLKNLDANSINNRNEISLEKNASLKCPYKNILNNIIENETDSKENFSQIELLNDTTPNTENSIKSNCPYENGLTTNFHNFSDNIDSTITQEESVVTTGCPMINKIRKNREEIFSFLYEIPYETPYDYIFNYRNKINHKEFLEKTLKFRSMPRHLRFTLFHLKENKLIKLRQKEFPNIYFTYEELREKAYSLYKKEDYKQAIKYYYFTYSIFKWLEFKDPSREKDILRGDELLQILDEDILEKRIETDREQNSYEEDCYKACLITILKYISLCYMHLRHFTEAISSLDEAISYSSDKVPELFLRRSQARTYNKNSNYDQLEMALKDIKRAINLNPEEPRFQIHFKVIVDRIEENSRKEIERIEKLIEKAKYCYFKIIDKKLSLNDYVYSSYDHIQTNSNVLDEMIEKYKNTLKFHTDSNNNNQVAVASREIEEFSEVYYKFKWYFLFDVSNLPEKVLKSLTSEDRYLKFMLI